MSKEPEVEIKMNDSVTTGTISVVIGTSPQSFALHLPNAPHGKTFEELKILFLKELASVLRETAEQIDPEE